MTKKDYQAIARVIHDARICAQDPCHSGDPEDTLMMIQEGLADVLRADNPRFSRERFQEACETGKCKGMRA